MYPKLLQECGHTGDLKRGKHLHAKIIRLGIEKLFISNILLNMYFRCGSMEDGLKIFNNMVKRDVVSWNTMIASYGQHSVASELLRKMQQQGVIPNHVSFLSIISTCSGSIGENKLIHACIFNYGFGFDTAIGNSLINMYNKLLSLTDACRTFDALLAQNVVSWTAIISGYVLHRQHKKAVQLFWAMIQVGVVPNNVTLAGILNVCTDLDDLMEGRLIHACAFALRLQSDAFLGSALVKMYGNCGSLDDARKVFDMISNQDLPLWNALIDTFAEHGNIKEAEEIFSKMPRQNVISWTAIIMAYAQHGYSNEVFQHFHRMQTHGVQPDKITFVILVNICANLAMLAKGAEIHGLIQENGFESHIVVGSALLNMYGKCGNIEAAERMFHKLPAQNVVSWTAMIAVYSWHGLGKEAFKLFQQMHYQNLKPNKVTYINILTACSHAGMLVEGQHLFISMSAEHGVAQSEEHLHCMIDILGRAGQLDEAHQLLQDTLSHVDGWRTLLSSCINHGEIGQGMQVGEHVIAIDPNHPSAYMLFLKMISLANEDTNLRSQIGKTSPP